MTSVDIGLADGEPQRHRLLLALCAVVVAATGCAGGDGQSDLAARIQVVGDDELACSPAPDAPPADFTLVFDTVALPSASAYASALQTNRRESNNGQPYYFAKTGLWWRGDAVFEIAVPDEYQDRLAIGWGRSNQPPAHSVQADCDIDTDWAGAPGGYWITEPMCAEIIVRVDGNEQREQIGLGTPCPGQNPPEGPSDT